MKQTYDPGGWHSLKTYWVMMISRFQILRSLCLLTIVSVLAFTSCASPNRSDGLEQDGNTQEVADDGFGTSDEAADNTAVNAIANDPDMDDLALPDDSPTAPASAGMGEDFTLPKADKEILSADIDENVLLAPSDAAVAAAAKEMAQVDASRAKPDGNQDGANDFGEFDAPPAKASGGGSKFSGVSRVPKIPGAALQRKGALLNRFYFLRKGDTPQSIAQLIYGSPDRAKDLIKWNGKNGKPGKLVYYNSPDQPQDREMRSFYQERNVTPEEYVMQKGDQLSKVAAKKYGHPGSWKEVAVINGLSKIEGLGTGTKIALYPANLTAFGAGGQSANGFRRNSVPPPPQAEAGQADEGAPRETYPTKPPPPRLAEPSASENAGEVDALPTKKKSKGFSLNIGKILEQNLFAVVIGGGVFVLMLLLMLLAKQKRKQKSPAMDEMNEEPFGEAPTKKKARRK